VAQTSVKDEPALDVPARRLPSLAVVASNVWLVIVILGFVHSRILTSNIFAQLWQRWFH
jgi:hypothetical protein